MGIVKIGIDVLGDDGATGKREQVEVLVDTGATLTTLPRPILERLGVRPGLKSDGSPKRVTVRLGDGTTVQRDIAEVRLDVQGEELTTRVMFGEPEDASVLGVIVLETLGLAVDPVQKRLVPTEFLFM